MRGRLQPAPFMVEDGGRVKQVALAGSAGSL
jgi:hypothetical protein